jgi:hypothetical protein
MLEYAKLLPPNGLHQLSYEDIENLEYCSPEAYNDDTLVHSDTLAKAEVELQLMSQLLSDSSETPVALLPKYATLTFGMVAASLGGWWEGSRNTFKSDEETARLRRLSPTTARIVQEGAYSLLDFMFDAKALFGETSEEFKLFARVYVDHHAKLGIPGLTVGEAVPAELRDLDAMDFIIDPVYAKQCRDLFARAYAKAPHSRFELALLHHATAFGLDTPTLTKIKLGQAAKAECNVVAPEELLPQAPSRNIILRRT